MNTRTLEKIFKEKSPPADDLSNWRDYKWQLSHCVKSLESFQKVTKIRFAKKEKEKIEQTIRKFPLSITPYYLSLINAKNFREDPIFKQAFPDPRELIENRFDMRDPLSEEDDSPAPHVIHRYPDRVLLEVSSKCSMYCRFCTRKRRVGDKEYICSRREINKGIEYIRKTPQIRDVLISGGDPLMLSDDYLDEIMTSIRAIPHVEIIRLGSRMPAVLPFRITDNLVKMLKKHQPLWINTHFNHPREITDTAREALRKLADAGFPLGNQSVLLSGINDCPRIIKKLVHKLVQNRVRPYYLYQCDITEGLVHFRTPVGKGIQIMENLIGHTSGLAVPTYVIDAPGGGGKVPILPNYIISWATNKVIIRNYEGTIASYEEPDSYSENFCDRNCQDCTLQLNIDDDEEYKTLGVAKLMSHFDEAISLTPENSERLERRR